MQDQLEVVMYDAFFDELGHLEKKAMMMKIAGVSPGFFSQLFRGGKQLVRSPGSFGKAISKAWGRGVAGAGKDAGKMGKGWEGLKSVWGTPQGKAAIVGTGGVLAGTGAAGYLAGRSRGGGQGQNVYVR